ncbi:MAG TPA: peptidoglycan editing factor PgeF, partial [Polyangiales bacterium]
EHVAENHRRLAQEVGYDAQRLYEVSQVHGASVAEVNPAQEPEAFRRNEADALLATHAGCAAGVRVADCAAVLLADPVSGAVAAVHAGWRGTVQQVVGRAVEQLCQRAGAAPGRMLAAVFPHIGVEAFEVGTEVAAQIAESAPGVADVVVLRERPHADLRRALVWQLGAVGLAPEHIDSVPGCTYADKTRFFSYRRDGARAGRHLAVIVARGANSS